MKQTHPLREYLNKNKIKAVDFGKKCKCNPFYIYQIMSGYRTPSLSFMQRISKASNGKIKIIDLVDYYTARNFISDEELNEG